MSSRESTLLSALQGRTRAQRAQAARLGLLAWLACFVLGPLGHLWHHRHDHHHLGAATLFASVDDHGHLHGDERVAGAAEPDHADGPGHLQAAVLAAVPVLPLFFGRLLIEPVVDHPPAGPHLDRPWKAARPRAPPVA